MKFQLPTYLKRVLLKMGMLMLIFSLCRLVFFIRNSAQFPEAGFFEFLVGCWFDLITCCLLFIPIAFFELFPSKLKSAKWHKETMFWITFFIFLFGTTINLIDVEYFAYTSSRSTNALFTMLGYGSDLRQQIPSYIGDYWFLIIIWLAILSVVFLLLRRIDRSEEKIPAPSLGKQTIIFFLGIFVLGFFARGGFVYKPIRPTQAAKFTESSNVPLVLNSAFTVINSWGFSHLEEKEYMPHSAALELFNPIHQYDSDGRIKGQNVCIIILESFTIEYINSLNVDDQGYTPFFDDLVSQSMSFNYAFANGKKSIDAVPSIIASVPKLMSDEYLLSNYSINELDALPQLMSEEGYSTAFYHGATNGSMNFDAFCSLAGFQEYYGRSEYDNDDDFDGTWGIWDEEFLLWSLMKMDEMKKPFFSTVFTISSHPPYDLPIKYEGEFDGPTEMIRSIQYTDHALAKWFSEATSYDWFNNTLFIFTADHTTSSSREIYLHERGKVNVPLIFYHPNDTFFTGNNNRIVGHMDIMPTVLDLIGYDQPFFSFGRSAFSNELEMTFTEIADEKMLFIGNPDLNPGLEKVVYSMIDEDPQSIYALNDLYQHKNLLESQPELAQRLLKQMQAIIQIYNRCLIRNQMTKESFSTSD